MMKIKSSRIKILNFDLGEKNNYVTLS